MFRRLVFPLVAVLSALALTLPSTAATQNGSSVLTGSTQAPRITSEINESRLTRLTGNVPFRAQARYDKGAVASSTQLTHIRLVLSRTPEQEAAMQSYLVELQNPASANYHKWLTPDQYGKLFGPADSDIAALVAWLESHGLKIETVPAGRTNIAFSGTVAQVEEAFHTTIHAFNANGEEFTANIKDPSIPTALASVVGGVAHLSTLHPRAHHSAARPGLLNTSTNHLVPMDHTGVSANSKVSPAYTDGGNFLYVTPADAATIYNTPNSFNANFSSGTSSTGSAINIGIGGDGLIQASTVANYRNAFTGSTASVTIINVDGVTANGDTDEAYIDTELSAGLAPSASIYYYTSTDLFSAVDQAIGDDKVDIFSLSFGACELDFSTSDNATISNWWNQAAMQGITITVSTGDSGSAGCDATTDSAGNNIPDATNGLAVNGLASTPYNIAVGGTDFYPLISSSSFSTYVGATNSASSYYRTAKNYIPEATWNDSTQSDTTISLNSPYTGTNANIVAGSGGKSSCSTNSTTSTSTTTTLGTCSKGYTKPTWQRGTGVPADGVRDLPDVSLMGGNGYDNGTWLICTDDTFMQNSTTYTTNCSSTGTGFAFTGFGGTSTSAPAFAGILALVIQNNGRLGQAAQRLYDLYNGSHSANIFHDVTVGNNSVACTVSTPNCVKNTAGYYYLTGYDTTTGYDLATGMGSVDASNLITYWTSTEGSAVATVSVTPSTTAINTSDSLNVVVAVAGGSGTPTGTVSLRSGNYSSDLVNLASGAYTFTIPAGSLSAGSDTLTVYYSGDTTYAAATGTASVTVTAPGTFKLTATAVSVIKGSTGTSTVTVTPSGGYFGSVVLTCSVAAKTGATDTPTCTGSTATIASGSTAAATGTITISTTAASSNAKKALRAKSEGHTGGILGATAALACIVLFGVPAKRKAWKSFLSLLVLVAGFGVLAGCGGGSGGGTTTPTDPGTTAGSYTVTVTGTDSTASLTTTTTFTVTVQ